jgi:hypothetical protein
MQVVELSLRRGTAFVRAQQVRQGAKIGDFSNQSIGSVKPEKRANLRGTPGGGRQSRRE